jgi:hypothetical protein
VTCAETRSVQIRALTDIDDWRRAPGQTVIGGDDAT